VALGMGREVVEGDQFLSFCPRAPQHIVQFSSVDDILENSQRAFWGLELKRQAAADGEQALRESKFGLDVAEKDGTLYAVGSTYSPENQAIYDGISRPGVRLVTFAPILKHGVFPLAEVLSDLLDIGASGMNRAAEIEFAVRLSGDPARPHELGFLQMRPLVLSQEFEEIEVEEADPADLVCASARVMGNGRMDGIRDLVVVDIARFDRAQSRDAAEQVARFNAQLVTEDRPYLLIGVGRWGSADPWLGIPVAWEQIAGARVIVETGFRDLRVTPSQGSHFFQNLTSFQVGYFTVDPESGGFVDWDWIAAQPAESEAGAVRHIRLDPALVIKMDGRSGRGIVYKPGRPLPESR
jgi:hypothetical protein